MEFISFSQQKGNLLYVLDLTPGMLQPLDIMEDDELLANLDIEKIVHKAEMMTQASDNVQKNVTIEPVAAKKCFATPISDHDVIMNATKRLEFFVLCADLWWHCANNFCKLG